MTALSSLLSAETEITLFTSKRFSKGSFNRFSMKSVRERFVERF